MFSDIREKIGELRDFLGKGDEGEVTYNYSNLSITEKRNIFDKQSRTLKEHRRSGFLILQTSLLIISVTLGLLSLNLSSVLEFVRNSLEEPEVTLALIYISETLLLGILMIFNLFIYIHDSVKLISRYDEGMLRTGNIKRESGKIYDPEWLENEIEKRSDRIKANEVYIQGFAKSLKSILQIFSSYLIIVGVLYLILPRTVGTFPFALVGVILVIYGTGTLYIVLSLRPHVSLVRFISKKFSKQR